MVSINGVSTSGSWGIGSLWTYTTYLALEGWMGLAGQRLPFNFVFFDDFEIM
jgi:hypothetical protein